MDFTRELTQWYDLYQRDLPWRKTKDPYLVWLSEIILQQTRVVQGLSYYHHFAEKYPTVYHLASAPDDDVMKSWQGLGYYSRARNLLRTARVIAADDGKFPKQSKDLRKLAGIGPYTAAAIASFCFNEAVPVIDGNVIRVLSRYYGVTDPVDTPGGLKMLHALAETSLDKYQPALYNQAIMDFGALQCKPGIPDCNTCPMVTNCYAARNNQQEELPVKIKKTKVKDFFIHYYIVGNKDGFMLRRRPENSIWGGLYELPCVESPKKISIKTAYTIFKKSHSPWVCEHEPSMRGDAIQHQLTHRRITATFNYIKTNLKSDLPLPEGYRIVNVEELRQLGVSRLTEKGLEQGLLDLL
jgi:A/G-specific adenine glycosylase